MVFSTAALENSRVYAASILRLINRFNVRSSINSWSSAPAGRNSSANPWRRRAASFCSSGKILRDSIQCLAAFLLERDFPCGVRGPVDFGMSYPSLRELTPHLRTFVVHPHFVGGTSRHRCVGCTPEAILQTYCHKIKKTATGNSSRLKTSWPLRA